MATKKDNETVKCQICKTEKKAGEMVPAGMVRGAIAEKIRAAHPDWSPGGYICLADLNQFRDEYVQGIIRQDKGELTRLENQVVKSLRDQELLTRNINDEFDRQATLGERLADRIAEFGGSWQFIGIFVGVLFLWVVINTTIFFVKPFDPYPYIFLNLILSCLAAIQAPVIMMSQNRQESRDRIRAEHDYKINLKAELEIRNLHEKIDHLLVNQWQRLMEIQGIQTDLMEELSQKRPKP